MLNTVAAGWRPRPFLVIFPSPGGAGLPVPLLAGAGASGVSALADAITKQEGWYPGSISWRNNNPGNLVFVGQPGAAQGEGGFAKFGSADAGRAALERQITLDAGRGLSLGQFIRKYAPPVENDTAAYLASIEAQTGFGADDLLSDLQVLDSAVTESSDSSGGGGEVGSLLAGVAIAAAIYLIASRF